MSSGKTSHAQFKTMVEFMEENGDLCKPNYNRTSTILHQIWRLKKWKELRKLLNSQGSGKSVSVDKWRKVWSDFKNHCKKKWNKLNRVEQGTTGPLLKMRLSDLEHRVIAIMGVQATTGMTIAEIGLQMTEESDDADKTAPNGPSESQEEEDIISIPDTSMTNHPTDDEESNTLPASTTPPRSISPPKSATPSISPTVLSDAEDITPDLIDQRKHGGKSIEDYCVNCEAYARQNSERERLFEDIERDRIRQRDTELQLQSQWLDLMNAALNAFEKYMSKTK